MTGKTGTDQASFLTRVRAALARTGMAAPRSAGEVGVSDWKERARQVRSEALARWEELLARLSTELQAVAGVVHRSAPSGIRLLVSQIARERSLSRVITWSEAALGLPGLLDTLRSEGLAVAVGSPELGGPANLEPPGNLRQLLSQAEIGVTGVDYAVAESGSLVLLSGSGKGRLVSCLPMVHLAILRPGQLVGTLEEVGILLEESHRHRSPNECASAITFITGPSRTADIELSLTRGVHGPKELHVIALS